MNDIITQIPGTSLQTHQSNDDSFNQYKTTVQLKAWAGFQSRQGAYDTRDTTDPSDGSVSVNLGSITVNSIPLLDESHLAAFNYLLTNQQAIKNSILSALLKYYPELKDEYGYNPEEEDEYLPDINHIEDFKKIIGLSEIHILDVSKDDVAYVGYQFGCNWDEEHGLGIMTHKDRIVEIGGADAAFLEWIAERDLDPVRINAEIEANHNLAKAQQEELQQHRHKKPWWKFW